MIQLNLLDACHKCKDFEPKKVHLYNTIVNFDYIPCYDVTCENIEKCRALLDYLKKEVNKNGK